MEADPTPVAKPPRRRVRQAEAAQALGIDVSKLVVFKPSPAHMRSRWQLNKAEGRTFGKIGTCLGVLEIKGARAHGIVLRLDGGSVECFHPMDLFPHKDARK